MTKLDYLTLLKGDPIPVNNIGHIRFPKLSEIADPKMGYGTYNSYINFLVMSKQNFMDACKIQNENQYDLELFDILFNINSLREILCNTLSFFISEKLYVSVPYQCFYVKNKVGNQRFIYKDNYDDIKNMILQTNYVQLDSFETLKPAGKHTAELLEKRKKYHKQFEKNLKNDLDISLPNIVSKLATYGNGLNLLNIWDYTVFQIYDQFFNFCYKKNNDMANFSYSIWGGDYKIPKWYKNTYENNANGKDDI